MIKLCIYAVGTCSGAEAELIDIYAPRIKQAARQIGLDAPHITECKTDDKLMTAINKLGASFIIVLDEKGDNLSSRAFATTLENWVGNGKSPLCFLIGGAEGLPEAIKAKADITLSLSAMTLPHMLARVVLYEQLWRALSIITHHPYHKA